MSIRNLDSIFHPRSIVLIGASARSGSVGAVMARNLRGGGFAGPIAFVNPNSSVIDGITCYSDVRSLPNAADLAVICTPAATIPQLIGELGERGTKGAVIVSAGFKELGNEVGRALHQRMLDAAKPWLMRIVGPNGIGMLSTPDGVNASFAHLQPRKGHVAFVAQSGAMLTTVLDWASFRGIGFSHLVSLGDMADVDFGDMLDYLANDEATRTILLYVEAITEARKFMSAARAAARAKPVIVIKAGRHAAAAKAALSHTGALAGADAVYDAAFRRAGILRVKTLDQLFDAVETLATAHATDGDRLAILTNGGGLGVLATDALLDQGGSLAQFSDETLAQLGAALPATWSHGNPVDIIGDAPAQRYGDALAVLLKAQEVDGILVLNCPVALASGLDAAQRVVEEASKSTKTILTSWVGDLAAAEPRQLFIRSGIPTYETPDKAIDGFTFLTRYRRGQKQLLEVPPSRSASFNIDDRTARAAIVNALAQGTQWLDPVQNSQILSSYGIATARAELTPTAEAAGQAAARIGGRIALKVQSPDITHKSDVGGVMLGLSGAKAVEAAAHDMRSRVSHLFPKAQVTGFLVQEMVERPAAFELIAGMTVDPLFGPVLLFGRGGTAVEVIRDNAIGLAPLNHALARDMISRTRVFRELQGYRDRKPADLDAIALTLVKLSQLVCDLDEIQEIEINPLLADPEGTIAVDVRARIAPVVGARRGERLAIRPYPRELEQTETVSNVGSILVRPIRPDDTSAMRDFFAQLSSDDVRLRFLSPLRALPASLRARFTQIDYDREMAFVLLQEQSVLGIGRLAADPDNERAEFAVIVRSNLKGKGLGWLLMKKLIAYARARGTAVLFGEILRENTVMIGMCRELGFELEAGEGSLVRATLALRKS